MKITLLLCSAFAFMTSAFASYPADDVQQRDIFVNYRISELNNLILKAKNTAKQPNLEARLAGQWYGTYHQAQLYPGSCSRDGYSPDIRKIKLSIQTYPKLYTGPRFEKHVGALRDIVNGKIGDSLVFVGSAIKANYYDMYQSTKTFCVLKNEPAIAGDVLVCKESNDDQDPRDPCGWWSFYVKDRPSRY